MRTSTEHVASAPAGLSSTDLLLALMALIWGVNIIVVKAALSSFLPLAFNAVRFPLASLALMLIARLMGAPIPERRYWKPLALYGMLGNTLYQLGFIQGLGLTRAGNAALIMAANPVLTALISHWAGQEQFRLRHWAGIFLSALGVSLVVVGSGESVGFGSTVIGDLLVLGAVLCWSLYAVGSRPLVHALGATNMTAWTTFFGTVPIVLFGIPALRSQSWSSIAPAAWGAVVYASLGAIVTGYLLWARGMRTLGSTRVAVYSNFTPVFAFLAAWPLLGETPTAWQVSGGVLIFLGLYLTRYG
ncbi:putative amino-acid metabolite efflux pump [bacterium HR33]|nr:putative amino-acid metabolite efflux pump [bacterium HR33]